MIKLFDGPFLVGSTLTIIALVLGIVAVTQDGLPVVGRGIGPLVAVAVIGMAGCAVGGISQAPMLGWTAPAVIVGVVLGVVALAIVAAGLFDLPGLLQPVVAFMPAQTSGASTALTATFALAVVIAFKWVIAVGLAVANR